MDWELDLWDDESCWAEEDIEPDTFPEMSSMTLYKSKLVNECNNLKQVEENRMKATMQIEIAPFTVPDYVLVEDPTGVQHNGVMKQVHYPLASLDTNTLEALCDQFKRDVFKKAGRESAT